MGLHEGIYSSWAVEFAILAREYCERLETSPSGDGAWEEGGYAAWLYSFLPLLFYKTTRFPEFENEEEYEELPVLMSEMEYERVRVVAVEHLGEKDKINLPLSIEEQERWGREPSLGELVADIYQELSAFLTCYKDGVEARMYEALVGLRLGFARRWGSAVLLAIRWLHEAQYSDTPQNEDYSFLD